jgi:hypothetical protein
MHDFKQAGRQAGRQAEHFTEHLAHSHAHDKRVYAAAGSGSLRTKPDQVGRFLKVATAEVLKVEPDATTTPPMVTEYAPTPLAQHRPSPPLSSRANSNSWPGVPQYLGID